MMTISPLSVVVPSAAGTASFLGCDAILLSVNALPTDITPDRREALAQAELLFNRLSQADIDAALDGLAPGQWRDLSEWFSGDDERWRFWRPMDMPNDPDALTLPPSQRQIMIRPLSDGQAAVLLVVGLVGPSDRVAQPMLAGLHRSGEVFIVDPKQPERCEWPLSGVAAAVEAVLRHPR